ncbi:SUMF1/EgtB/PvdO family nonheme iron enzyme [Ectopseudomonas mendocina]|uniref:SUMF1/EgtB/PvdO family nonheme iron enzyme n=1 Tax=Ectopseudomonas mendocina TaxID=300 RepID=UPI0005AB3AB5|nr:SUMF1/EgtB/PvdO family nonheme iron enzyme [Pseudomonas mendocina]VEE13587.1 putative nitrate reductase [Pseudomonas mendocina]
MRALLVGAMLLGGCMQTSGIDESDWVRIAAGTARYQAADASGATFEQHSDGFAVMRRQVSQAEYAACVAANACLPLDGDLREASAADLAAVGVSWMDASAYAQWLTQRTGVVHRLPTYAEWVLAAGEAFQDIQAEVFDDARNPAQRWLAEYDRESRRKPLDPRPRAFGSQGSNANGLLDVAGNVWEWTDSCFGKGDFCGIRIAAGQHPSGLSDFVRDPISGACSVGVPPSNLGFRLVRE